jgi:hypothetical protein
MNTTEQSAIVTPMTRKFGRTVPPPGSGFSAGRSHCEIGFEKLGPQEPYFHVLGGTQGRYRNNRWEDFGLCADHNDVRANWPEYAHLIRWHLAGVVSGPMYYEDNALYHARIAQEALDARMDPAPAIASFKRHVVFGAVGTDGDDLDALIVATKAPAELRHWLATRRQALMAAFRADVDKQFPGMFDAALAAHGK